MMILSIRSATSAYAAITRRHAMPARHATAPSRYAPPAVLRAAYAAQRGARRATTAPTPCGSPPRHTKTPSHTLPRNARWRENANKTVCSPFDSRQVRLRRAIRAAATPRRVVNVYVVARMRAPRKNEHGARTPRRLRRHGGALRGNATPEVCAARRPPAECNTRRAVLRAGKRRHVMSRARRYAQRALRAAGGIG